MTGKLYVGVVQAVLLFGSEIWVMTLQREKAIMGFHHREVRLMAGIVPKFQLNGTWIYQLIGEALTKVGLEEIRLYITGRQNTVTQYIATRTIVDLCIAAKRRTGM